MPVLVSACCCSVSDNTEEIHACIDASMHQLTSLWDDIGIVGDQRVARYTVVLNHVRGLMEDMVQEETALRDRLVDSIDKLHGEVSQLCTELHLPQYEVSYLDHFAVTYYCWSPICAVKDKYPASLCMHAMSNVY